MKSFRYARGLEEDISAVIIKVSTDEGTVGLGEAFHSTEFAGETLQSIKHVIDDFIKPELLGQNPFEIERIVLLMDRILEGNNFAKSAVDLAMHDLVGKALNTPVYNLLGGKLREKVQIGWEVGLAGTQEMVDNSVRFVESGIKTLKIKVGVNAKEDINRIRAIHDAVGSEACLRADANQGWTVPEAMRVLKKVEDCELEFIEQPVAGWNLRGMAEVRRATSIPVMADESVWGPTDAFKVAMNAAADMINIKVNKVGGLYKARKVAAIAEASGITCMVGSEGELDIAQAAKLHMASSTNCIKHASEFTEINLLADTLAKTPLKRGNNDYLEAPNGPGLGVELDESKMRLYSRTPPHE
jgi:muconate/chloromuconate cycloisomerase